MGRLVPALISYKGKGISHYTRWYNKYVLLVHVRTFMRAVLEGWNVNVISHRFNYAPIQIHDSRPD